MEPDDSKLLNRIKYHRKMQFKKDAKRYKPIDMDAPEDYGL